VSLYRRTLRAPRKQKLPTDRPEPHLNRANCERDQQEADVRLGEALPDEHEVDISDSKPQRGDTDADAEKREPHSTKGARRQARHQPQPYITVPGREG
jgi:hypothetical protein